MQRPQAGEDGGVFLRDAEPRQEGRQSVSALEALLADIGGGRGE
jgi:hypothetical protein